MFGVDSTSSGFQEIFVPSLFQNVLGSCTRNCNPLGLRGVQWIVVSRYSSSFSKHSDWLSKILSSPFVGHTHTAYPLCSTSSSTTLFLPVAVVRYPKRLKVLPACSEILYVFPKSPSNTAFLVLFRSFWRASISLVASSSRSSSLYLFSVFSLALSTILSILSAQSNRSLASSSSSKRM